MAISEFEVKRCERELEKFLVAKRPPAHVRNQLDFGYRIENQSVELVEIRPDWQNPDNKLAFCQSYVCQKGETLENILATPRFKMAQLPARTKCAIFRRVSNHCHRGCQCLFFQVNQYVTRRINQT
jgi:hypothetical protein